MFAWLFPKRQPASDLCIRRAAISWAADRFPKGQRLVAAYVATLLCEELLVELSDLEPETRFIDDLDTS